MKTEPRIVGLMVVRNEDWVLRASLAAALKWCDAVVVLDHLSTDDTPKILANAKAEHGSRICLLKSSDEHWDEMHHRQRTLDAGRELGGTHFAIVDGDEIPTADVVPFLRQFMRDTTQGNVFEVPMIPTWRSLGQYRDDDSVWARSWLSVGFPDAPGLSWKPDNGYHHHHRAPYGITGAQRFDRKGVMHLQFASWRRLRAKHAWYKMVEAIRWPDRMDRAALDAMYSQALDETGIRLSEAWPSWRSPEIERLVDLDREPWQEHACRDLWAKHGPETFRGLNLFGVVGEA